MDKTWPLFWPFFAILFGTFFWNAFFASSWTFSTATILGITSVEDSEFETEKRLGRDIN